MKLPKSDLGYVERQFRDYFTTGYCKACRQWDVLLLPKRLCFDCLDLRLTSQSSRPDKSCGSSEHWEHDDE